MTKKTIFVGSDHAGFELKGKLKKFLEKKGFKVEDKGSFSAKSCDYPDFARLVGESVSKEKNSSGILICGTGIGMSIAASKINGIRAAIACNEIMAKAAKEHNNANVICLGARVIGFEKAKKIVNAYLNAKFAGERHLRRVKKINALDCNCGEGKTGKGFELLEHKADMGIKGFGETFEEAFEECAKGMFSIMTELKDVQGKESVGLTVKASGLGELLIEWLNELLSLADQKEMFFSEFKVEKIEAINSEYELKGKAGGEKIDEKKHELKTEVKAATYSGLKVEKEDGRFIAQCVVDV